MCGLAGFMKVGAGDMAPARHMVDALSARGPDDGGAWADAEAGVALAHRRLAVLDLSPAGHQPMVSPSGRYVIVFNGEIYNHLDLRAQLPGVAWRGGSDTETLLAAIEAWGLPLTLQRAVGMFAIALWDRQRRELSLARDRLGEKPLYYGWQGECFLFGSELKALRAHPAWRGEIDREALTLYMRYGYVPLPRSIQHGIRKLIPGSILTLSAATAPGQLPEPAAYWSVLVAATVRREEWTDAAAIDELEACLRRAIAGQSVADVPLGAFLSGGVDSSTVVALMQVQSSRPVHTFAIGFTEKAYDEAGYARAVAAHLGTEHTEFYVSPADAQALIPRVPDIYDEPFGDSSQIPTTLVAQLARRRVTVSLSGDGGDELFGGYPRYRWSRDLWRRIGPWPRWLRQAAGGALLGVSPAHWDGLAARLPARWQVPALGDKLHKLADVLAIDSAQELHLRLLSAQRERASIVIDGQTSPTWADAQTARLATDDLIERMMFHDQLGYLGDGILTKVDRAAMSVSLETRVPLLDHRVVELAWRLPLRFKLRDGQSKWLLRQVLYRHVPCELIERPKQGFSLPLDSWLRGPLRDWAEALLDESRLQQDGLLHVAPIRRKWAEHLSGERNWQHWLWHVLMFQAWRERWQ